MADSETTRTVALTSLDGQRFEVPEKVAAVSNFVRTTLEGAEDEVPEVPLPNVSGQVLAKIMEFCTHHVEEPMNEIPKPLPWPKRVNDIVQDFYAKFVYLMSYEDLFELVLAANYLDINPLLELCLARVARNLVNKTPDQVREAFTIEEEFTPEEYEIVLTENKWTTEKTSPEDMEAEPEWLFRKLRGEEPETKTEETKAEETKSEA